MYPRTSSIFNFFELLHKPYYTGSFQIFGFTLWILIVHRLCQYSYQGINLKLSTTVYHFSHTTFLHTNYSNTRILLGKQRKLKQSTKQWAITGSITWNTNEISNCRSFRIERSSLSIIPPRMNVQTHQAIP